MKYVEVDFYEDDRILGGSVLTENLIITYDGVEVWRNFNNVYSYGVELRNDGYYGWVDTKEADRVAADANKMLAKGIEPEAALIAAFSGYHSRFNLGNFNPHQSRFIDRHALYTVPLIDEEENRQLIERLLSGKLVFED